MKWIFDRFLIFLGCFCCYCKVCGQPSPTGLQSKKDTMRMEAVQVYGENDSRRLERSAYRPTVLDMRAQQARSTPMAELLSALPGIRVRQSGGMGSDAQLMVAGIAGKGIPVFLDGVPISLLGSASGIEHLSSAWVDHIQVYKGVVPVSLGADALGGAVNITSSAAERNQLDVSYSIGSWQTHQAALSGRRFLGKAAKRFVQVDLSYRHSDNDYRMDDVEVVVDGLGNTEIQSARRFHDAYTSHSGRLQYGIIDVPWADEFRLSTAGARIDKQWQHGLTAVSPWGEVTSDNTEWNHSVSWRKSAPDGRWQAGIVGGYNHRHVNFTDTGAHAYYWDGSRVPKSLKGESGFYTNGRTPRLAIGNGFVRANVTYALHENHRLSYTVLVTRESVRGEDEAGIASFKADIYAIPQRLAKGFNGLSLSSEFLGGRLVNVLAIKHYRADSHVATLKNDNRLDGHVRNTQSLLGYGNVLKYRVVKRLSAYAGYEYTTRMPDGEELFGDGLSIAMNGKLVAERSHNFNTGLQWEDDHRFQASLGGFYRRTADQLFLGAVSLGMAAYLNLMDTKAYGLEAAATFRPATYLSLHANGTYQHAVLETPDAYGKIADRYVGSRIPNVPYLFGNAAIDYAIPALFGSGNSMVLGYGATYVHGFFLGWERDGLAATKARIPTQFVHHVSLTYAAAHNRYSVNVACRNLTDERAFDHFKVQRPGRGFFLKLRYFLQSQ